MLSSVIAALTWAGCSCGEATMLDAGRDATAAADAFSATDVPVPVDVRIPGDVDGWGDVPPAIDAFTEGDATPTRDVGADATSDAPSSCPRVIPDRLAGICDGRGRAICEMWARESAGGAMASAVCLGPEGLCARASECTGTALNTCRCGSEPACGANEVCISGIAGYSCTCAP